MPNAHDVLFRTLADPTRRAIFERLCREGEQTVGALTARAGISQPAVSKHLGVLKQAGLVRDRHEGRQTHYSAQLGALAPLIDWTSQMARVLAEPVRRSRRSTQTDGPMTNTATETRTVVVEREMPHPPEKLWRALTQPHLMEEWLMKNDFKPVVGHHFNLRGEWGGVLDCEVLAIEPNKELSYTWNFKHDGCGLQSAERGDVYAHANAHGDPSAHGAVGLPAGSEAGLWRRQRRMAAILREAGRARGADGLKSVASRFGSFQRRSH